MGEARGQQAANSMGPVACEAVREAACGAQGVLSVSPFGNLSHFCARHHGPLPMRAGGRAWRAVAHMLDAAIASIDAATSRGPLDVVLDPRLAASALAGDDMPLAQRLALSSQILQHSLTSRVPHLRLGSRLHVL